MVAGGAAILTAGAAVVFLGVIASLIFERYRIPDIVLLLLAGITVGPLLGIVDPASFAGVAGPFTTLALVVILFEGGLDLRIKHLKEQLGFTTVLLFATYAVTAAVVAVAAHYVVGLTWTLSLLFGLVVAPLSSSILIPLVGRLKVSGRSRSLLIVESALGDVVAVLAVSIYAGILTGGGLDLATLQRSLVSSFLVGTLMALGGGLAWLGILKFLRGRPYAYMITFAAALLLFGLIESVGGNGVVGVLVFALVLGNGDALSAKLPFVDSLKLDDRIRWFHAEMSFFVRTFFFFYLGLLVNPRVFGLSGILATAVIVGGILAVRALMVWLLARNRPERADASYLTFLVPRGLASAALATVPAVVLLSEATPFQDLIFAVILLTNLAMTAFILVKERGFGDGAEPEAIFLEFDLKGLQELPVDQPPT